MNRSPLELKRFREQRVSEEQEETDRTQKPTLSILPFKNLNENEDSSFLIDGVYEDILTELSMVRQLSIVSRQSSDYLIQGSIRSSGSKVRVTVSLLEADTKTEQNVNPPKI